MDTFEAHRPYLFAIAYRMVGSVSEAEDMVQETYLRFRQVDEAQVASPKAYLSTIVTRLCLNYLESARIQREQYLGPWLPEPLLITSDNEPVRTSERLDSISMAFLVLLEKLTPYERAVFLLREVFNYDYEEIAAIIGQKAATCRQYFSRAKKHLTDHRPRFEVQTKAHTEITTQFLAACQTGDLAGLEQLLAEEVVCVTDGGGKVGAPTRPIIGRDRVARFLLGLMKQVPAGFRAELALINGELGIVGRVKDKITGTAVLDIQNGQIQQIWAVHNPDKLKHLVKG
ncbi:MAG: RNA polymerase sigma-70 factor [Anaerolineales bacterium]|nr:RNA polymerase sigma-70 factor [Anaerolineales bacterium]